MVKPKKKETKKKLVFSVYFTSFRLFHEHFAWEYVGNRKNIASLACFREDGTCTLFTEM